jgi:hypothetical protein
VVVLWNIVFLGGGERRFLVAGSVSVSCVCSFAMRMRYDVYKGHAVA